ncbi:MAG: hypothetical protein H6569_04845 [Lewinellaceae bacterium]|nr:hypothetical protein [Lewinellaceae bacterium]
MSGTPQLYPANVSVFDIDAGLPISCTSGGLIDRAGRLWINPCYIQEEHQTVNFYKFDGEQSTFIGWEDLPERPKGQAVLSGFTRSGELFGYFRGTGVSFVFDPDTRKTHFQTLDTAGVQINFMGYSNNHGIILHALSPANHLVYRLGRDSFHLLLSVPRLDAGNPYYSFGETSPPLLTQHEIWIFDYDNQAENLIAGWGSLMRIDLATGRMHKYTLRDLFRGAPPPAVHLNYHRIVEQDYQGRIILYLDAWKQYIRLDPTNGATEFFDPFSGMDTVRQTRHPLLVHYNNGIAKDSAGNLLFYGRYLETYRAVLLDKAGKYHEYSAVLNAARAVSRFSNGLIQGVQGRDFRRQAYLFLNSGLAVVDLKLSGSIRTCLDDYGTRAIVELAPGHYLVNVDGRNLMYTNVSAHSTTAPLTREFSVQCADKNTGEFSLPSEVTIAKDAKGFLWVPYKKQLVRFREDGSCTIFPVGKAFFKFDFVDPETVLLVAENHLYQYHLPSRKMTPVLVNGQSILFSRVVNQIYVDSKGLVWIAALDGLHRFDLNSGAYRLIGRTEGFQDERMMCIEEDADGRLWIGTYGGGLHIYNTRTGAVSIIDQKKGLSNNIVIGMLTDDSGTHWLSTYQGITLVSAKGEVLSRLYQEDGLSANEYNRYSYLKSSSGALLFGSVNGVNIIEPAMLKSQLVGAAPIRISLSGFSCFDAKSDSLIHVTNWAYGVETINLPAAHRSLSLQFTLSNLVRHTENNFAYKLEGTDIDYSGAWIYIGANNQLNLQDLPAGKYDILIRGCDYRGNWVTEPLRIPIEAAEFFYLQSWFILLCVGAIIALVLAWMFQQRRERKRLEKELAERTDEIMRTRNQLVVQEKLASLGQLTAGIAHEIKKPLNFVNNFALDITRLSDRFLGELKQDRNAFEPEVYLEIEEYMNEMKQNALDIKSSGSTADRIVQSMMDHAREDSVQMQWLDLNHLIDETAHLAVSGFRATHSEFTVTLNVTYDPKVQQVYGSPLNLTRAFLNILNNACYALYEKQKRAGQFKPALRLQTLALGSQVEVRIRDNGMGIDPAILKDIFAPFYTTKPTGQGNTGLGLSICYDIVVAEHGGQLDVVSEPDVFTEFILRIPIAVEKNN